MDGTLQKSSLGIVPQKPRIETGHPETKQQRSVSHSEWRIVNQMRAIKQHLGLGTILGTLAIIIAIGAPAVKQGEINGTTNSRLDTIVAAQKDNDERQTRVQKEAEERQNKALLDGLARIEAAVGAQGNEMHSLRESMERRIDSVAIKADAAWDKMTELKNKVGIMEAQQVRDRKQEK